MRVGVMMCAFREARLIIPAIKQFDASPVEEIIVACSATPWSGEGEPDETAKLAIKAGATTRLHPWKTEAEQKNWIMEKFYGFDWVLMFAPDMYMTRSSLLHLLEYLRHSGERAHSCDMMTYWKNYDSVIYPHHPFATVAIRPDERFTHSAALENMTDFPAVPGVLMHHLSWVRTDDEVLTKISTYSHAHEIRPDWYEQTWKNWNPSMRNFGPTVPNDFEEVRPYSVPEEIKELIREYGKL